MAYNQRDYGGQEGGSAGGGGGREGGYEGGFVRGRGRRESCLVHEVESASQGGRARGKHEFLVESGLYLIEERI
jgi:hypothetical protein